MENLNTQNDYETMSEQIKNEQIKRNQTYLCVLKMC